MRYREKLKPPLLKARTHLLNVLPVNASNPGMTISFALIRPAATNEAIEAVAA